MDIMTTGRLYFVISSTGRVLLTEKIRIRNIGFKWISPSWLVITSLLKSQKWPYSLEFI